MKALTDTNALLWIACAPKLLTDHARRAIVDSDEVCFSIVNIWEIGLKLSKGGFDPAKHPPESLPEERFTLD